MLFAKVLAWLIRSGDLVVIDDRGRRHRFGGPDIPGLGPVVIRLHHPTLPWRLALRPHLVAGEAYMDGSLTVEQGSLADFLALATYNIQQAEQRQMRSPPLWRLIRLLHQHNPVERSRRNVAHHYDLSGHLYSLFLDDDLQYSCAYFQRPDMTLDEAQEAKKRHIAAKLLLKPGQKILDIGSGWGGMALTLARIADVEVTGITLSQQQLAVARRRAAEAGLADRVRFELQDYRHVEGRFDRIVSVGMFEHVGVGHYGAFFDRLRRDLLTPDGVAVLHSIGRSDGPGATNPWLRKYIFPGGYSPALSEVLPVVEGAGLIVTDIEILRLHYAETLVAWRRRFEAHRAEIAGLYDERFCRMWEFYLAGAEMAFRYQGHMVFQMQLAMHAAAVPDTRDYIAAAEAGRSGQDDARRAAE